MKSNKLQHQEIINNLRMISQKVFKPEIPGKFNVSARQILPRQHIINEDEDVRSKGVKKREEIVYPHLAFI